MRVVSLDVSRTHDLRRRVLRGDRPEADVRFPQDDRAEAFHLGVLDETGAVVAVATYSPEPTPLRPGRRAFRLRGMAVDPEHQGRGLGRLLFEAGLRELRRRGAEVLWANARDSALDFYRRRGMEVVGEGFLAAGGIPHHVVMLDVGPGDPLV